MTMNAQGVSNAPLMFSDEAGQLLEHMASSYNDRHPHHQHHSASGYSSYQEPKPDPVLWFPGGDADCGSNANSK